MNKKSMMKILKDNDLCLTTNPKGTDKGSYHAYIEKFYEGEFARYRDLPIRLMEIGFRHGASLALWTLYFEDVKILGLDNFSDVSVTEELPIEKKWVEHKNIEIKIGDAYSIEMADSINYEFDIIIDDGPHWLDTQIKAIEIYLPKLSRDGLFVIEDILAGGWSMWPLAKHVPLTHNAYFYAYGGTPDNSLFVIKRNSGFFSFALNRVGLLLQIGAFLAKKIVYKFFKIVKIS